MPSLADKVLRDHVRYTGDGLPNAPTGAPLPVGDPLSGPHEPSRKDVRDLINSVSGAAEAADAAAGRADQAAQAAMAASAYLNAPFIATDGRSLHRMRKKIGMMEQDPALDLQFRMGFMGDSWSELTYIPFGFVKMLEKYFGTSAGNWISAKALSGVWASTTLSYTGGWTEIDASVDTTFPYGVGPDGHALHTTGAAQTITISTLTATFVIYTKSLGGTWRYRVDGGNWVVVNEPNTGDSRATTVNVASGSHTIEINTAGNTGRVFFCGIFNNRSARALVTRMGNGGLTGADFSRYVTSSPTSIGSTIAHMKLDMICVILGTNDYRLAATPPSTFLQGLRDLTTTIRAHDPTVGLVFIFPMSTDQPQVNPIQLYRDAMFQHCIETKCEMLNLLDSWNGYDADLFQDNLHPNYLGGRAIAQQFKHAFIPI